ncbi:molybdopterin oxidoreductase family protein [Tepidimonas taiwanensis]|uniref:Putative dimethyl sulfoxide reductase chain YnfE n=1 Tax=Tepidimonas taiwanensis TaxID=307486 RepID=A0A554XE35_9BURK|nr:molybdopterin oxidoreductase family protein [Tepidimonas taiwanensis]TSE34049.1 putative dimethyl sulfoxide reductase chain YnfE [Tepidimonas taiwanensis]UBQ04976.1 molybdopterin oxidoreductase family protein [Tepidimonas taiwanensis]
MSADPPFVAAGAASADTARTVIGACPHDCPDTCSFVTTVHDGRAVRLQGNPDHAQTGGVLCTKVSRYLERVYHPDRLRQPLRCVGPKGAGCFEPVTWDEALDDIAARLRAIAARDPQAILPYSYAGTMGLVQGEAMAARFFHRLGASLLDRTICASAGAAGLAYTLGGKVGMRVEHFAESKLILIWGSNSIGSNLHFWRYAQQAKRAGARLVCIDPRRTETAEKCHAHLALLPGTDAALAYALMHECIVHGWVDDDYVQRHTLGREALRERALQWPPARAAAVCGLPVEQITALARDIGACVERRDPVAIRLNYGMQRVRGGANAVRAVACLPTVIGAWRHRAGGLLLSSSGWYPVQRDVLYRPDLLQRSPCPQPRVINMSTIGDALLRPASPDFGPAIEALIVYNSNPVAVAPESRRVVQGFAREDLFTVVLEQFQTDTADYADYVLPATTQLEHWDIHLSYGHTDVLLNRPAIAPLAQARPNTWVFRELARRMGFDEPCFADDDLTLCRQAFGDAVDFETLLREGHAPLAVPDAPFANGGFPTPSGKFEFASPRLAAQGLDPLPAVLPNHEPPGADPRHPLAMISPPARNFLNSTFVNVTSLRDAEGEPVLEMHPDDAAPRGIADGDWVEVFNDRGRHRTRARLNGRARPGVVVGLGIWWRKFGADGTNVNELTSQALTDLGGGPTFYDCAVEVLRVAAVTPARG